MHLPVSDKEVQTLINEVYITMNRMMYNTGDDFTGLYIDAVKMIINEGRVNKVTIEIYETYQKGLSEHYLMRSPTSTSTP